MLNQSDIAINSLSFWAIAAVAIAALNAATTVRMKSWVYAAVNATFLFLLLGRDVTFVALFIVAMLGALQLASNKHVGAKAVAVAGFLLFSLFVFNKLSNEFGTLSPLGRVLSIVGYSFIALRCIEVLRAVFGGAPPPSLLMLANYLVPFHMLAAGPIQAYEDYRREPFWQKTLETRDVVDGLDLIARGLFNKLVICFVLQKLFLNDFSSKGPYFIVEVLVFTLWSYLDFSAYSNIALGIGKLAGVSTPVNFRNPLIARNVIEFWDRWHISLSQFVKRNVFMPIQISLMRREARLDPLLCACFATGVSFVLVGLWHGLSLGWLIWGSLHAFGLIVVRVYMTLLQRHLTPAQMLAYRASVPIRVVATAVTYTYIAFAFVPVAMLTQVSR